MLHKFPKEAIFIFRKNDFVGTGITKKGNDLHIRWNHVTRVQTPHIRAFLESHDDHDIFNIFFFILRYINTYLCL